MKLKSNKGSIAIFVLVGLLFMSAFLIIMYAANVNKSKTIQEQFNIISGIYSKGNDEESYTDAYTDAYTALRKKNRQTMTAYSENSATLELTKTFNENMSNYRIYGNSVQNGTPSPDSPVEIQSVGDLITDTTNSNYGKYKIPIKLTNENEESEITNIYLDESLRKIGDSADYIDFKNQKIIRNVEVLDGTGTLTIEQSLNALATPIEETIKLPELQTFEDYTKIEVLTEVTPSKIEVEYMGYTLD